MNDTQETTQAVATTNGVKVIAGLEFHPAVKKDGTTVKDKLACAFDDNGLTEEQIAKAQAV